MKYINPFLCLALTATCFAEVHFVGAYDMTFVPDVIHVNVGDTVHWEYMSGSPHTVTTGTDCAWDGDFHEALSFFDPVVEWVVPEDAPGEVPYFCAPHCINDMTATIHVSHPCISDITGDGVVNVSDLLLVIDQWGSTDSPADVNFDGIVDVTDLLIVVGNWGPCE